MCYLAAAENSIVGNYNAFHLTDQAFMGSISSLGREQKYLAGWIEATGQERESLQTDPLFANPDGGDFHLQTEVFQGRYVSGSGWFPGFDAQTSPLIDAGDKANIFANEPGWNGRRINIGLYGNTPEASIGRTSAWVYVAGLRHGGGIKGTASVHWVAGGAATGHSVRLEFSPDGGESWSVLSNAVSPGVETWTWNTTLTNDISAGLLKVISQSNPLVYDQSTRYFTIRNTARTLYINDTNRYGDVYSSGSGSATNWMASSARPLSSLALALSAYDLEGGDTLLIDTGEYLSSTNTVVGRLNNGRAGSPLQIIGSTNESAGGSILYRGGTNSGNYGLVLRYTQWVNVSNLTLRDAHTGVRLEEAFNISLGRVRAVSNSAGFSFLSASNVVLRRTIAAGNATYGLISSSSTNLAVLQSVFW